MKQTLLSLALLASSAVFGANEYYYVRSSGDATSWNKQATTDPTHVITITDISELSTYTGLGKIFYLAKGTYYAYTDETKIIGNYYLQLALGEKLYGGFSGTESTIDLASRELMDRDGNGIIEPWEFKNETAIDGLAGNTQGVQSKRLLGIENSSEADGLTIQNFSYKSAYGIPGGPIYVGSYLGIRNTDKTPPSGYNATSSGKLANCYMFNVSASATGLGGQGGAAILSNKNSVITNCLFEQCQSNTDNSSFGGAIYVLGTGGQVKSSVFRNNRTYFTLATGTVSNGGAIYGEYYLNSNVDLIIENSLFYNNSAIGAQAAKGYGGAVRCEGQSGYRGPQITNCTFSNNYNGITTSGNIEILYSGSLVNCINQGGSNGFRAYTSPNATNFYMQKCVSTVANLNMAADASYPTVTQSSLSNLGLTRTTSFNGAVFPLDAGYDSKVPEIHTANFKVSDNTSFLATNYGLTTIDASYNSANPAASISITATLPTKDITGADRNLLKNTLGAYMFNTSTATQNLSNDNAVIHGQKGLIIVQNCDQRSVQIYSSTGILVSKEVVTSDRYSIPARKGLYIVKAGSKAAKVLVD